MTGGLTYDELTAVDARNSQIRWQRHGRFNRSEGGFKKARDGLKPVFELYMNFSRSGKKHEWS